MAYFNSLDLAAIAICSALWGVLNRFFAPIFFQMFGLPFLCDLIGFSVLIIAVWWIRKLGAITLIGVVATGISFALGGGIHFLGFTVASIFFDFATRIVGYNTSFKKSIYTILSMMTISIISAAMAGYVIGTFFMAGPALTNWGGVLGWAGLHAVGGIIGGIIGTFLVLALQSRMILVNNKTSWQQGGA